MQGEMIASIVVWWHSYGLSGGGAFAAPLEIYDVSPTTIPAGTAVDIQVSGLFSISAALHTVEEASSIYRLYVGTPPWTSDEIASFRLDDDPATPEVDSVALTQSLMFAVTPPLPISTLADVALFNLLNPAENTSLPAAIEASQGGPSPPVPPPLVEGEVWVDFDALGGEFGTPDYPFTTIAGALGVAQAGDTIKIMAGETAETPIISAPVRLAAINGAVTIGSATPEGGIPAQQAGTEDDVPTDDTCSTPLSELARALSPPTPIVLQDERWWLCSADCDLRSGEDLRPLCPGVIHKFVAIGGHDFDYVGGPVTDAVTGTEFKCDDDQDGESDCTENQNCYVAVSNARNSYGWEVTGYVQKITLDPGLQNLYTDCYLQIRHQIPAGNEPYRIIVTRNGASTPEAAGISNTAQFDSIGLVYPPDPIAVTVCAPAASGTVDAAGLMKDGTEKIFLKDSLKGKSDPKAIFEDALDVHCCKGFQLYGTVETYSGEDVWDDHPGEGNDNYNTFSKITEATWTRIVIGDWNHPEKKKAIVVVDGIEYVEDLQGEPRSFVRDGHAYIKRADLTAKVWAHEWGHLNGWYGGTDLPDLYDPLSGPITTPPLLYNLMNDGGEYFNSYQCKDMAPREP